MSRRDRFVIWAANGLVRFLASKEYRETIERHTDEYAALIDRAEKLTGERAGES